MIYNILISLIAFLVAIAILVGIHEYGHFIVARLCGVKVLEFSLGFGKVLWKRQGKKGTQYQLALIPIGGYVKMLDEREGPIPLALQAHAFNRQPIWKRSLIILAGPVFNLLLAFLAYWLIFMIGFAQIIPKLGEITPNSIAAQAGLQSGQILTQIDNKNVYSWPDVQTILISHVAQQQSVPVVVKTEQGPLQTHFLQLQKWNISGLEPDILGSLGITPYMPELPSTISDVVPGGPAAQAGMKPNDQITAINNNKVINWQTVYDYVQHHPDQIATFTVLRNGQTLTIPVHIGSQLQNDQTVGKLGVMSSLIAWPADLMNTVRYNPWQAIGPAWHKLVDMTSVSVKLIGKLITGHISLKGISGPIGIAQGAGASATLGPVAFLSFLALISISLGVVNLFPIPILDGGQLVLCWLEGLFKKPLPEKIYMLSIQVSIFFLLGVMTLALYNDIMRIHH